MMIFRFMKWWKGAERVNAALVRAIHRPLPTYTWVGVKEWNAVLDRLDRHDRQYRRLLRLRAGESPWEKSR
jgi:hypothetical protein